MLAACHLSFKNSMESSGCGLSRRIVLSFLAWIWMFVRRPNFDFLELSNLWSTERHGKKLRAIHVRPILLPSWKFPCSNSMRLSGPRGSRGWCLSAASKAAFLAKMPHAVVLRSAAGAIRILVTSADVTRPGASKYLFRLQGDFIQTFTDCTWLYCTIDYSDL